MGFESLPKTTADLAQEQMAKLRALFPECVTEGPAGLAVDFDLLRRALSPEKVVEGPNERYRLEWPGKRAARYAANAPTASTLRPVRERSKDFDTTQNLYIEGDNLEALKLLRTAYSGKVKLIYIDPPYNTGHDFIYHDKYVRTVREEMDKAGLLDDEGRQTEDKDPFQKNDETNGRYHSDWLTMMYPRLLLARDLLADDGVIFISIDDNEQANLKRLCDEIFGAGNFVANICHKSRASVSSDKIISSNHNLILFYTRDFAQVFSQRKRIGLDPDLTNFKFEDERGPYRLVPVDGPGGARKGNPFFEFMGVKGYFRFSKETMTEKYAQGLIVKKGNSLYQKYYREEAEKSRKKDTTWWEDAGLTSTATIALQRLMGGNYFDNPKPVSLILRQLKLVTNDDKDAIVLDFFSGSATTAHAVMQLNAEDGGNRKFILVQLPEKAELGTAAAEAGFQNICEIGEERIRRAGEKILGEHPELRGKLDVGFRVLRVDEKNEAEVAQTPDDALTNWEAALQEETIKEGRTEEDLLFQALLRVTEPLLVERIEREEVAGLTVWSVADGFVVACLAGEGQLTAAKAEAVTRWIVGQAVSPSYVAFREAGFADDSVKLNVEAGLRQAGCKATLWVL